MADLAFENDVEALSAPGALEEAALAVAEVELPQAQEAVVVAERLDPAAVREQVAAPTPERGRCASELRLRRRRVEARDAVEVAPLHVVDVDLDLVLEHLAARRVRARLEDRH